MGKIDYHNQSLKGNFHQILYGFLSSLDLCSSTWLQGRHSSKPQCCARTNAYLNIVIAIHICAIISVRIYTCNLKELYEFISHLYTNQEKTLDMINKNQFASAVENMTSILYFYLWILQSLPPQYAHIPNVRKIWNNYLFWSAMKTGMPQIQLYSPIPEEGFSNISASSYTSHLWSFTAPQYLNGQVFIDRFRGLGFCILKKPTLSSTYILICTLQNSDKNVFPEKSFSFNI